MDKGLWQNQKLSLSCDAWIRSVFIYLWVFKEETIQSRWTRVGSSHSCLGEAVLARSRRQQGCLLIFQCVMRKLFHSFIFYLFFFSPLFLFYIPELYSQVGPPLSSRASFRCWIPEDSWTDVQVSWTRLKNQSSLLCSSVLKKMFWLQKGKRLMFYFLPLKQTVSSVSLDKFRKCFS